MAPQLRFGGNVGGRASGQTMDLPSPVKPNVQTDASGPETTTPESLLPGKAQVLQQRGSWGHVPPLRSLPAWPTTSDTLLPASGQWRQDALPLHHLSGDPKPEAGNAIRT